MLDSVKIKVTIRSEELGKKVEGRHEEPRNGEKGS